MINLILAAAIAASPCVIDTSRNDFGTIQCNTADGVTANISSSVFDVRQASCVIDRADVVTCKNVKVVDSSVVITLRIDLRNKKSTVY